MKLDTVRWAGVDGGQYDSLEPSRIPKNGWARAYNVLPYAGRMGMRPGSSPFGKTTPTVTDPIACVAVKDLEGAPAGFEEWALLVIGRTCDVALMNAQGKWSDKLQQLPGGSVVDDEMPWVLRQRGHAVYAARRNSGGLKRIGGSSWTGAGHPVPGAGATASWSGSGGSLSANTYRVAYTYYSEEDDHEGNGIEITVTGTPAANGKIVVPSGGSGLQPAASDVHYSHFRVYMTQPGGAIFYKHTDVPKATTGVELTTNPTSSQVMPTRYGLPDSNGIWFEIWNERGWVLTKQKLLYSDFSQPEGYAGVQNLPFNPDDNDEMTTGYGWGDYLVVARRRSMVLLEGNDRTTFKQKLWTEMAGSIAPHAMKDCEGELVWLSEDGFCSATVGEQPKLISNTTVKKALARMDKTRADLVVGETLPDLNVYVAAFPRTDGSWGGVAYNWRSKAWSEFEFPAKPLYIYTGFDSTGAVRIFAIMASGAQPYVVFEGNTDDGSLVSMELISLAPDTGGPKLAGVKSVALLTSATRYPVTIKVYRDGDTSTPIASRTVSLKGDSGWKRISLNPSKKGTQLQVGISYRGADPFWVSDMAWVTLQTDYERPAC